jgi:hypothetical protein
MRSLGTTCKLSPCGPRKAARRSRLLRGIVAGVLICPVLANGSEPPPEPLHRKIDRLVEAKIAGEPAPPATDAEFLRRVSLDLTGVVPTSSEARAFLDDPSPYKRRKLVDRSLETPEYARRMQDVFDAILMERRDDVHVPARQWREFLRAAFSENMPYDRLVARILSADGSDPRERGAAKFYLDRLADPNLLTRDIGRMFLGRDLQCAQCHDHPLIDDYKQSHYYGIFAFLNRTTLFDLNANAATAIPPDKSTAALAEKADGDVTFSSVFKKKVTHKTGPRILDGPSLKEPSVPRGAEYLVAPEKDKKVRTVPRYSRRGELARQLAAGSVADFSRNIVNRLWGLLMGRGLVHPYDMHHSANPPQNAELLDLLAREFAAMHYDVKAFLRELALTQVYERASEQPHDMNSSGGEESGPETFAVAALKPLSVEQLAWSVMQALGLVTEAKAKAAESIDGHDPRMRAILAFDAKRRALRAAMIEESIHSQLERNVLPFVHRFAAAAGQPQDAADPTVHQALFLSNGGQIQSWLAPSGRNLIARLAALTDASAIADELYLSLFSRRPAVDERALVERYLQSRGKDRVPALQELAWAMLLSTEFRFNH